MSKSVADARNARLCQMLGIDFPVLGAPMGGVAGPELVAAVSSAGGLGLLGHASLEPERVRAEIRAVRAATDKPFGVGLLFPHRSPTTEEVAPASPPPLPSFLRQFEERVRGLPIPAPKPVLTTELAGAQLEVALAQGVDVIACGLGTPKWVVEKTHAAGALVISLIGTVDAAERAAADGTDILVAQGHEAGGHTGRTSTIVLVPQVVDAVDIPVVAAGGIADGRGMAAAFALGAEGVLIGTRLLATPEARTAQQHKDEVVAMRRDETEISRCYTGKPSRMISNEFITAWRDHQSDILPMPLQWRSVEAVVAPAKTAGSIDIANWPTGQCAVLVRDEQPAADVVRAMVAETRDALSRVARFAPSRT